MAAVLIGNPSVNRETQSPGIQYGRDPVMASRVIRCRSSQQSWQSTELLISQDYSYLRSLLELSDTSATTASSTSNLRPPAH